MSSISAKVIAAFHLPSLPGSGMPDRQPLQKSIDFTLRNVEMAVEAGVKGVYLQDLGDYPSALRAQPHTVAAVAVIGAAVRKAFPNLELGVCLMSHGAKEALAAAQAMEADFVRLKVYVGAMVKMEGILEGCAFEAIQYRQQIGAENISILADIYDRTGEPLGRSPLVEEARQAAVFGRADGLVLTGRSLEESLSMLNEVRGAKLDVPLYLGGGATPGNIEQVLEKATGVVVSSAFKLKGGFTRQGIAEGWDAGKIKLFMEAVKAAEDKIKPALSPNAQRVQDTLKGLGFNNQVLELNASTRTSAEAAQAVGCQVAQIAKSIIFKTSESQRAVLIIASGINRVSEKRIAQELGEKVEKPDADFVKAVTGFPIGGVPPLGHQTPLITFIDQDLLQYEKIWAAAGMPTAVFQLTPEELVRMTGAKVLETK
jgi:membrane complex biogenesis BtpA family protein